MIAYPRNWHIVGNPIQTQELKSAIIDTIIGCKCNHLSLSGGIDSSLLLHYMSENYPIVNAYTIGLSENHPDVEFSRLAASRYKNVRHLVYIPTQSEITKHTYDGDYMGDCNVRMLYNFISEYTDCVIAGDGIDEYTCGYYKHISEPSESVYYDFIRRLYSEQLEPLNKNSGNVKVLLPYLSHKLIYLLSQIPLSLKTDCGLRKALMVKLAILANIPEPIISRRKYGLCDAGKIKGTIC